MSEIDNQQETIASNFSDRITQLSSEINKDLERQFGKGWNVINKKHLFNKEFEKNFGVGVIKEDKLTGFPAIANPEKFRSKVNELSLESINKRLNVVIGKIDINQLKPANDNLSREHGNALIVAIASRLSEALTELRNKIPSANVYIFREQSKGDEFYVLITNIIKNSETGGNRNVGNDIKNIERIVTDDRKWTPNDQVARSRNVKEVDVFASCGFAGTYEGPIQNLIKRTTIIGDKIDIKNLELVLRKLSILAENRLAANKFRNDLPKLKEKLSQAGKENITDALDLLVQDYAGTRITNFVLENLMEIVCIIADENALKIENTSPEGRTLEEAISVKEFNFNEIKKIFEQRFGKVKSYKTKKFNGSNEELINLLYNQLGNNWQQIPKVFLHEATPFMETDSNAKDDKLGITFYSTPVRTKLAEEISEGIRAGKRIVVVSIDANQLKSANNISWTLGDFFIIRHGAVVSGEFAKLATESESMKIRLVARDTAGDEILVVGICNSDDDIKKITDVVKRLNGWTQKINLNEESFTFSTSAFAVRDSDLPEELEKTKTWLNENNERIAYEFMEALIRLGDKEVKLLKTADQLEKLPLEDFLATESLSEAMAMVNDSLAGGRISRESLSLILATIAVKAVLTRYRSGKIKLTSAQKIFEEIFAKERYIPKYPALNFTISNLVDNFRDAFEKEINKDATNKN